MLIVIDNYDSFTYNLVHFLGELGAEAEVFRNDRIRSEEVLKRRPEAIILSPGPCTPNEAGICVDLIQKNKGKIPLLGVCLGHQSIAQAYGGKIIRADRLMHGKLSEVEHEAAGVFANIPSPFNATRYHSLIVEEQSLPSELEIIARSKDNNIMGICHKEDCVYGIQFHPESIACEHGHALLKNFLELARERNE
ncbi:MAG: anthranilate synthase component II [Parvibaculales bacterium]